MTLLSVAPTTLSSLGKTGCLWLGLAAATAIAHAAPLDELRSLAQLPPVNLEKLKQGAIVTERGAVSGFARGIYLESSYFVRAPMETVGNALLHRDPLQHRELDVRLYQEYSFPGTAGVFDKLQLKPAISDDNWLLTETARVAQTGEPGDLHLTKKEAELLRRKATNPSEAWQEILRRRSESLAQGGITSIPPYGHDKSISPGSEYRGLLSLAPKAARHFQPITEAKPMVAGGKAASEAVGYWEAAKVREHTTLQLGIFTAQKSAESWQLLDCIYYPTDTYFMALDLFHLWPVDGGTLVWQVGFVSAPFRSYLGGVDRFVAGKMMTEQTLETIKSFRSDVEKRR